MIELPRSGRAARAVGLLAMASLLAFAGCSKSTKKSSSPQKTIANSKSGDAKKIASDTSKRDGSGSSGTARGKKTPTRPLPRLSDAVLAQAREMIDAAKAEYNSAIRENGKPQPDKNAFFRSLNVCKQKLDDADTKLEPVTMWEEEMTMGDWKVSAEEDAYLSKVMRLVTRIDRLRSAAEKISRAR